MNILIVEDDDNIANVVSEILQAREFETVLCDTGSQAVELIKNNMYDLILLDVMLPGLDGFQVMQKIAYRRIPVIFMTARQDIKDRLYGFELGAEDYITKPFNIMELLARIEVVLRRNNKLDDQYQYDNVHIDAKTHCINMNGEELLLRPKEYELALYLVKNQGMVLSREMLMHSIWGDEYGEESRTLDNHILHLRKKLGWEEKLITIPRIGYRLEKL